MPTLQTAHIITPGYNILGQLTATTDNGRTLGYQYDVAGNRTRITWPDAYHANYAYDVLGRILNITENGAGLLASYGYDTSGRRTSVTLGNGAITSYTYEVDDALNSLSHNMTGSANDVDWTYDYNTVGQLTRKVITQTNSAYEWLPVNNRNDAYVANGLNQYASVAGTVLVYDGNGNLTSDGIWSYGFDSENRLLSAAKSGTSASYRYDPVGRRSAKVVNGLTTEFLNDGVEEIADYDGVGTLLRRYVHGPGVDEYLVMYTGTGTTSKSYFHANHQGSIVAMTDSAGNVTEQHSYDSYGNSDELTGNPFRYTGRRLDAETGLYYNRARYYSPAIGRFLQTDPIGYGDGLNMYAYVSNDPVNYFDPMGQCKVTEDDQLDCEEPPENEEERTEEQQEAIDKVRQDFIKVGKEIQENGTEEEKQAWEDITCITFKIEKKFKDKDGNKSDTTLGTNTMNKIVVWEPGFGLKRNIDRKHMAAHEIFHSERSNRRLSQRAKTKKQKNFMEKMTDRMAMKFIQNRFDPKFLVKIGYFQ